MSLTDLGVCELARLVREGRASAREVVDAHLERIERVNPLLNAIVTLDAEGARAAADRADQAQGRGEALGPLHGVPFTLKDMLETAGMRTTMGVQLLESHVPTQDAVVAERLKRAGGILLGKTNMAMSVQTVSQLFGRTVNPYDRSRTTGGSSGGAAAAVASRMVPFEVGTDLSGSIRMPASFCGIFGLKPTLNRVPNAGMIGGPPGTPALGRGLGVAGPMARQAGDVALLLELMAGAHPRDPDVPPVTFRKVPPLEVKRLRVAFAASMPGIVISRSVVQAVSKLAEQLGAAGAVVEEARLPFSHEELLTGIRKLFAPAMAALGAMAPPGTPTVPMPSALDYMRALDERDRLSAELERYLSGFDGFICPAVICPAFPHTERGAPIDVDGVAVSSTTIDHPSLLATFTGTPALVAPIGLDAEGLPIGVQCIGPRWSDERMIALGELVGELSGPLPPPQLAG